MPCCGSRERIGELKTEQMWDYINLDDFKNSSCLTGFSYMMVWVFLLISVAVYAVDTFTAVNLLVFSRWSGQIKPSIPFTVSRWIFAVCIIISFVLLFFRWLRTYRVMRSGGVAESYLDPLAVRVQTIRMGSGKGWKRFLVFAELTKSKKGADYVALFSYFSFEAWLRIVFADGPRQVVNAITLYSVMQLDLIPEGDHAAPTGTSPVVQFFINIKALAEKNDQQAAVLFGMLFTLIIWVFSALSLAISVILYLIFLWHHIPSEDGSLRRFCRRKINTRLERIVKRKVNKALAKGLVLQDRKPNQPDFAGADRKLQPLIPTLPSVDDLNDKGPSVSVSSLSREPTQSTLPPYTSRPGTAAPNEDMRQPTLPDLDDRPPLSRTVTQGSAYSEGTSLMGNAAPMGYIPLDRQSPAPRSPPMPFNPTQNRPYSPASQLPTAQNRPTPGMGPRPGPMPVEGPGRRTGSGYSETGYSQPPSMGRRTPGGPSGLGMGPIGPPPRTYSPAGNAPPRSFTPIDNNGPAHGPNRSLTAVNGPPRQGNGYVAFNPAMSGEARSQTPDSAYSASFARLATTTPSNEYGRLPPNRSVPHNGPQRLGNYDPYYGSAM